MAKNFWKDGLKFQCQGSGNCCVSRNGYGHVYLTIEDRRRMAKHLGISTAAFTRKYCDQNEHEVWKLKPSAKPECTFLVNHRCSIYEARPTQCRTWPFWPEILNAKAWNTEMVQYCPGTGKGKTWSKEEIETQLNEQKRSEDMYGT